MMWYDMFWCAYIGEWREGVFDVFMCLLLCDVMCCDLGDEKVYDVFN